jgi:hypothetical protein
MKKFNMDIKQYASMGGVKRSENLSPSRKREIASIAAKARWAKKNHVCDYSCRCVNCGARIVKHNKYSECQNPVCKIKGV